MDRIRHKRNYDLHSWSGVVLGLVIYVIAFTGCFALFYQEFLTWEDPVLRLTPVEEHVELQPLVDEWNADLPTGTELEYIRIDRPTEHTPYIEGWRHYDAEDGSHVFDQARWNAQTGERLAIREQGLALWLLDFHRDLMWPEALGGRTVGRGLVGIFGVILMLSIISGVVAHVKIREEFFSLRWFRSPRLRWQDTHKVVGLWGLPFFSMISFTGAILGIVTLLAPAVAVIAFKGDTEAVYDAVLGAPIMPTGVPAEMMSFDQAAAMTSAESGALPERIFIWNVGDETATFDLFFPAERGLVTYDALKVSAIDGVPVSDSPFDTPTLASQITEAMAPLHYGTYNGIWLKFVYFGLGLSLAIITALGLMMWIERRQHGNEGTKSERFYRTLSHINTGVVMGLPVATLALFYLDKLYVGEETARLATTGWTYFGAWVVWILYAFIRRNDYKATREILLLCGLMGIGMPVLNGMTTGDWFFVDILTDHAGAAYVDLTFLIGGALTALTAWALPNHRVAKQSRSERKVVSAERAETQPAE